METHKIVYNNIQEYKSKSSNDIPKRGSIPPPQNFNRA